MSGTGSQARGAAPLRTEPLRPAVRRQTLPEQIVEYVRDRISQNELRPGQKITIQGLAEELGVSMTPVREALKILSAERLVKMVPNRGAVIAEPDHEEVAQMLAVYIRLEMMAGELAAQNATAEDIAELRALADRISAHAEAEELLDYFHGNQAFHLKIAEASGNAVLADMHSNLNARLYHVRFRGALVDGVNTRLELAAEHHMIVERIENGDSAGTAALLHEHFRPARHTVTSMKPGTED